MKKTGKAEGKGDGGEEKVEKTKGMGAKEGSERGINRGKEGREAVEKKGMARKGRKGRRGCNY